ncbi:SPFH domain-containing protein [Halocatena halophila]|uniref:SPFH domain-containing protein n=1 Tax=Halocatena halophila TaxID=2814576 RepID=UPI002ED2D90B
MHALPLQIGLPGSILVLVVLSFCVYQTVEIVKPHERRALWVLGEYKKILEPGLNYVPPFISITESIDMQPQTIDVPRQEAITWDDRPVTAVAEVTITVFDAERAIREVEDHKQAVKYLSMTTRRAVIGDMERDDVLYGERIIAHRIQTELEAPLREWGIDIESVTVTDVSPKEKRHSRSQKRSESNRL